MAMYVSGRKDKLQSGSDEMTMEYCDHCRIAGNSIKAAKRCSTCEEFLCTSCSKIHTRATSTKKHSLEDIPDVDTSFTNPVPQWQECSVHAGMAIHLFCQSHNKLCCLSCLKKYHQTCPDIAPISALAKDIDNKKEFKSFMTDLNELQSDTLAQEKNLMSNKKKMEFEHDKTVKSIANVAVKAHLCIDKLKDNTIKVVDHSKHKNEKNLTQIGDILKGLNSDLQIFETEINRKLETDQPERVFITWKNFQSKIDGMKTVMGQVKRDNSIKSLRLDPTEEIDTLLNAKSVLGTLSEAQVTLNYVGEVNVKSASDQKYCSINGIAIMSPSKIIVSDYLNKNIKVIDISNDKIVKTTRQCAVAPNHIALLNNSKVGVALCNDKTLQLLSADDKLDLDRHIKVDTGCLSVIQEQLHGHLIVSYHEKVQVLDPTGIVIREFITDTLGNPLFKCARHLALSPDQNKLYVADKENYTVTCLSLDGEVKYVYRDAELKEPSGIVTDDDCNVLVCSRDPHSIHVLSPDCVKLKIIAVDQHKLKFPYAAALCSVTGRLYISSTCKTPSYCNSIKVFDLT